MVLEVLIFMGVIALTAVIFGGWVIVTLVRVLFRGQPEVEEETGEFDDDGNPKLKRRKADDEHLIRKALERTKGNRTRAAELWEISHRALLYKIKDYKITEL